MRPHHPRTISVAADRPKLQGVRGMALLECVNVAPSAGWAIVAIEVFEAALAVIYGARAQTRESQIE